MAEIGKSGAMSGEQGKDSAKGKDTLGDRQTKMKEDEYMEKNQDPEAVKKTEEKAAGRPAEKSADKSAAPQKKKNIIQIFRPQNSKTGMVKPGSRPKSQGGSGNRRQGAPAQGQARPQTSQPGSGAKGQGAPGRGQGLTASQAGTRPQGMTEGVKPQQAAGRRPQGTGQQAAGQKPQSVSEGVKPQQMAGGNKPQGTPEQTAGMKMQENVGQASGVNVQDMSQTRAGEKTQGSQQAATMAASGTTRQSDSDRSKVLTEGVKPQQNLDRKPQSTSESSTAGQPQGMKAQAGSDVKAASATSSQTEAAKSQSINVAPEGTAKPQSAGSSLTEGKGQQQGNVLSDAKEQQSGSGRGNASGRGASSGNRQGSDRRDGKGESRRDGGSGRGQDSRREDNRGENRRDGGYNRNQDGRRDGQGGRSMSVPKPAAESKPLEKESRKRTERGDRNRTDKGEKLDRMEKNVRPGQKNPAKNNAKNNPPKKGQAVKAPAPKPAEKPAEVIRTLTLPEKMTISELADAMKIQASAIIKKLFLQGTIVTVNQEIDFDKAEEIALEYNCICEKEEKVDVIEELLKEDAESEDEMVARPPVVCVMGHVDHGKTSLLDAIRHTHVIDKEAGGITQHIGAYVVSIDGQKITFLDTPGHEAFTAMRMRGANSTDIAILVVAADDGVMPQTVEAINHAKAAGIEIIVAINKIDKPSANIERVKQELSEYELIPEDWGGSTVVVPVSAHTHEGIDNLLEMILLTAEVLELRANPNRKARGLVIEAELDKGKGPVATVLVQKGTLHVGDPIAAGSCYGKIRAMMDDKGRRVKQAGPSTPVEILGLSDVPNAGEIFICMDNEKEARSFAETFISEGREKMLEDTKMRMSLDDLYSQIQAGKLKELDLIVKADVQGSVEAVKQSLLKLSNEEVVVKVIHSGVGAINESDVILASASNAIIIGFNIRPDAMAKATAERENVDVRLYRVIYDAIADVESAMKGMLDPVYEEKIIGHAEVRQLFKASGVGTIAGSYVTDGVLQRGCKVRITREDKQIYEGGLASLKRFKDDVKEVRSGFECGLVFDKFNDIMEEDKVEAYVMVEVPR
ncbi:MAG: translation initiation factor IF-2 [Lachnospiraceae bacterium]|nr:translation initiation factor IF-2 [Lachnospiraceae bacterium]